MIKLVGDADTDRLHGASILADSKVIQTAVLAIRQASPHPISPPPLHPCLTMVEGLSKSATTRQRIRMSLGAPRWAL